MQAHFRNNKCLHNITDQLYTYMCTYRLFLYVHMQTNSSAKSLLVLKVFLQLLDLGLQFSDAALERGDLVGIVLSLLLQCGNLTILTASAGTHIVVFIEYNYIKQEQNL